MLLNKALLKKFSNFPANYDLEEVMNYVDVAEKIYLIPLIGKKWYYELQKQVDDNELDELNSTALVECIYPYLGFCVYYEALPIVMYKTSEVGIVKQKTDTNESISLRELTLIQQHTQRQIEARKKYLIDWLKDHIHYYRRKLEDGCECHTCCCHTEDTGNTFKPLYTTLRKCVDLC